MKNLRNVACFAFVVASLFLAEEAQARCHSVVCDVKRSAEVNGRNAAQTAPSAVIPTFVPNLIPKKTPLANLITMGEKMVDGVKHLGEETWKIVKRPFVETGKFLNDPWGWKKKFQNATDEWKKRIGDGLEKGIAYAVLGLIIFIAVCGLISSMFSRLFARKPQIIVVTKRVATA
jgi:hypothetical protein